MSARSDSTAPREKASQSVLADKASGSDSVCRVPLSESDSASVSDSPKGKPRAKRVGLRGGRNRQYTLAEKLTARTIQGPSCWNVQGYALPHNGYVQIASGGVNKPDHFVIFAHRLAWRLANGNAEIPAGSVVMHACDNPRCVNPSHLSLGSQQDNIRDAVRKGRWTVRKLSDDDVAEIRALAAAGGLTRKQIGDRFGVARNTISSIVTGATRTERIGEPHVGQGALQPVLAEPHQAERDGQIPLQTAQSRGRLIPSPVIGPA